MAFLGAHRPRPQAQSARRIGARGAARRRLRGRPEERAIVVAAEQVRRICIMLRACVCAAWHCIVHALLALLRVASVDPALGEASSFRNFFM